MINNYKRYIVGLFVVVLLLSFTSTTIDARFTGNISDTAFEEDPPPPESGSSSLSGTMSSSPTLETYVIQGAGYFLKAYSETLLMMNKFELFDLEGEDIPGLKIEISKSIDSLEKARDIYGKLLTKAKASRYNESVIKKLTSFDYKNFKNEKGLNSSVFNDVEYFLSNGDVIGYYAEFLAKVNMILADLNAAKNMTDANTLPTNTSIWRLNQRFSETQLFGQYVAEVFFRIQTGE